MGLHAVERLVADPMPERQVADKYALHLLVFLGHKQTDYCHRHAQKQPKLVTAVEAAEVCCTEQHSMELYMVLSRRASHDQQV